MPCRNAAPYIDAAAASILAQTVKDFELLITDDGSRDNTWSHLERIAQADRRVVLIRFSEPRGIVEALNGMLEKAQGVYVARMDADDLCDPRRFERQLSVLEAGNADVCGTWMRTIGRLRQRILQYPEANEEIRALLLFQTAFSHPSVMLRATLLDKGIRYRPGMDHAEDYDLWVSLMPHARFYNLPEPLYIWRQHSRQVSEVEAHAQWRVASLVRQRALDMAHIPHTADEAVVHGRIRYPVPAISHDEVAVAERWLLKLLMHLGDDRQSARIVADQWYRVCLRAAHFGSWTWKKFRASPLARVSEASWRSRADLRAACLVRLRYRSPAYRWLEQLSLGG